MKPKLNIFIIKEMQTVKKAAKRMCWYLSGIIDMIVLFLITLLGFKKPSHTLTRSDINQIRKNRKLYYNDTSYNQLYRGQEHRVYLSDGIYYW